MKNLISIFAMLVLFTPMALAQMTPKGGSMVMERSEEMSLGKQTALVVQFGEIDAKIIGKQWEEYVKKYYGGKAEWQRKQKEWFTDDVNIPAIGGATPIDLHARVEGKKSQQFMLWVNMGTNFLNSRDYPEQYAEALRMLETFRTEVVREQTRVELSSQEQELKKLEKELEKLVSAHDRYNKEIEKAKEAIKKAEDNISQNERDQQETRKKIEAQQEAVKGVQRKLSQIN